MAPSNSYKCGCFNLFKDVIQKNADKLIAQGIKEFRRSKKKGRMTDKDQDEMVNKIELKRINNEQRT